MFDIKTSRDFYAKLLEDFGELQKDEGSARAGINCAIAAYHMHEWVWGDWLKSDRCTWAQLKKSAPWYCRVNGRTYRLSPTKDKMWQLYRVATTSDTEEGALVGKYQRRGDATKAVANIAYQPEPSDWPG